MIIIHFINRHKKALLIFITSSLFFFSIGHHTIKLWEKAARIMIGLFVVFVPILGLGLFLLVEKTKHQFNKINRKPLPFMVVVLTLLISGALAWRYYHLPVTYHQITITPVASQNQKVELIEIKANGNVIRPTEKEASERGWQLVDGVLTASSKSQSLTVSFKANSNSPLDLLFYASPESGSAKISIEHEQADVELTNPETRQKNFTLHTHSHRGIPNWLFIPFLILVDLFTFGCLTLAVFFLQDVRENLITRTSALQEQLINHRKNLLMLLVISCVLHLINALAVPLLLDVDSPSYIKGAMYLLEFGNFDGVSMVRGPGSALLYAPVLFFFGRNPWGIKILLHLLAIACVPVSYRIGWQLGKNQWVALASGLVTALSPDLFLYSNYLMSDLPNVFFVLVFCTFLISALETLETRWVFAAMLMGSFAALFRSENITLLMIGGGALIVMMIWRWKLGTLKNITRSLGMVGLALVVAALPLFWWSFHNQRVHGFFGLSNYAGEVLYDGWVYFGDASKLSFTDKNSQAVQEINSVVEKNPITTTDQGGTPTGWEIYPSLIQAGYTTEQAFNLLENAAWDSIKKDESLTLKLLFIKLRDGLTPGTTHMLTLPLPTEDFLTPKMGYFDQEHLRIPIFINLQRGFNGYLQKWYDTVFPYWVYLCLFAMTFSLYRSPRIIWLTLILITATRIFIPNIMGLSHWRYTVAGIIPLQIIAVHWIAAMVTGIAFLFRKTDT